MADPSNGQMTIYSNDMKSYGMRNGVAQFLGMPRDQVRVVWMEGPQGYGRTAADDAGFEAAYLAKEIGRPVRVQWMRHEETAWDTKGPAFTFKMRGGLDAQGNLVALDYNAQRRRLQSRRLQRARHGADRAAHGHAARHAGRRQRGDAVGHVRDSEPAHGRRRSSSLPLVWETPLRTGNLRDPERSAGRRSPPSRSSTSWRRRRRPIPVEFRMKLLTAEHRPTTAGSSARGRSPWSRRRRRRTAGIRVRHRNRSARGNILTGRGIAYTFRSQTVVARDRRGRGESQDRPRVGEAAGVRARLRAGRSTPRRCAARSSAACSTSLSRALHEEVQFDTEKVTSVDWISHPTLHARRHAGADRRRAGERRSESEPARSAALRRRRDDVQADDRGGRQRDLRCDRRSAPPGAVPGRARARRAHHRCAGSSL